ncbi:MAG: protein phosphatase 2C domain-containing protein [Aureispira sp.]|nr:protein phosphatase 2C domain-containing protein [Aureispira sp.]
MSDKKTTDWVVAYASAIGNGHIQFNIPCQDSCAHKRIDDNWAIAVVADGAGSARLSHIGSDFVVRNALHCFEEVLERTKWSEENFPSDKEWRTEALRALQIVMQRLLKFSEVKEHKFSDLACTVLVTIYSPFGALSVHIGDGRAAYSDKVGEWKALITPFRGDEANETVFITSAIWTTDGVDQFVLTDTLKTKIRGFALMSDGCEKGSFVINVKDEETQKYYDPNQPYPKFFEPNVHGLRQLKKEGKTQEEINKLWEGFLTAGHKQFKHEIDDKTMILGVITEDTEEHKPEPKEEKEMPKTTPEPKKDTPQEAPKAATTDTEDTPKDR